MDLPSSCAPLQLFSNATMITNVLLVLECIIMQDWHSHCGSARHIIETRKAQRRGWTACPPIHTLAPVKRSARKRWEGHKPIMLSKARKRAISGKSKTNEGPHIQSQKREMGARRRPKESRKTRRSSTTREPIKLSNTPRKSQSESRFVPPFQIQMNL